MKIYELVSSDVFAALVSAARASDLPIAAHVPLALPAAVAGPQVDSMEHLRNVELACASAADDLLEARARMIAQPGDVEGHALRTHIHAEQRPQALAQIDDAACAEVIRALEGTIQVPTLRLNTYAKYPAHERTGWRDHLERLPEPVRAVWAQAADQLAEAAGSADTSNAQWSLDLVGRMHAAGVPIGAGTDTPIGSAIPGYSLHTELERLVEAGLDPLEALAAATVQPAAFFSIEGEMGQVAPDYLADLVLLDADPLHDIRNTREIAAVISKGMVVRESRE